MINGDFETNTTGWTLGSGFTRSNEDAKTGSYAIKQVSVSGFAELISDAIAVLPNINYAYTFWYKMQVNSGAAPVTFIANGLTGDTIHDAGFSSDTAGVWVKRVVVFNTGVATSIKIRHVNWNGNVSGYYDNVSMTGDPITVPVVPENSTFLQVSGPKFTLGGNPFYMFGCTVYSSLYYWNASTMPEKLDPIVEAGFNIVRFTNYSNMADGLQHDENAYFYLDRVLNYCRERNLKVLFEVTQMNEYAVRAGNVWGDEGFYGVWEAYAEFVCNRINTINGIRYRDDDTIAMWSIAGELGEPNGIAGLGPYYSRIAGYFKANDPNHLICTGAMNPEQIYDDNYPKHPNHTRANILSYSSIDVAGTEGYYDSYIAALYPMLKSYSESKNKPWIDIEFGYDQNYHKGDATRARRLRYVMDQGLKNGCAGHIFWNYDDGVGAGYGVNPKTPECWQMLKTYAKTTEYSPRLKVL